MDDGLPAMTAAHALGTVISATSPGGILDSAMFASQSPSLIPPTLAGHTIEELEALAQSTVDASFAGFAAESVLYGIFAVLWVYAVWILVDRPSSSKAPIVPRRANRGMLLGSILIFAAATAHWALSAIRIHQAIRQASLSPYGAAIFLAQEGDSSAVARHAMVFVSGWILDVILVYRVYILYSQSVKVSLIPGLATVGSLVTGSSAIYQLTTVRFSDEVYGTTNFDWITSAFALSLFTNALATGLILYKTARVHRALKFWGGSRALLPVVLIIVESAALYSAWALVTLVGFLMQLPMVDFAADVTAPIVGISFASIIVRVAHAHPKPFIPDHLPPLGPMHGITDVARRQSSSSDLPSNYPSAVDEYGSSNPWGRRASAPWLNASPPEGVNMGRRSSAPWIAEPALSPTGGWFSGVPGIAPVPPSRAGDSSSALLPIRRDSLAPLMPLAPPPPVAIRFPGANVRERTRTKSTVTAWSDDGLDIHTLKEPETPPAHSSANHTAVEHDDVPLQILKKPET